MRYGFTCFEAVAPVTIGRTIDLASHNHTLTKAGTQPTTSIEIRITERIMGYSK
jgi:hypothetical protein